MSNMRKKVKVGEYMIKNWLLISILICILCASLFPQIGIKGGPLKPEYSIKYGAVCLIFFISGINLKTESIIYTLRQYKLHVFIQAFTFFFIPLFMQVFVKCFDVFGVNIWVLRGFITVACMPPPVSSAVILTRAANGNETAAVFNSVLGSFIGILITPISLLLNLGVTTIVPLTGTVIQLIITVIIPLICGQIIQKYLGYCLPKIPLSTISQCALILIIFTTFCETFHAPEDGLSAADILFTVFFILILQIFLLWLTFRVASYFTNYFDPQDVIAAVFCATHKSLTLGVPILRIMFHGFSHLSQISLPLLVYHPIQIILGGMLVSQLKDWSATLKRRRPPV